MSDVRTPHIDLQATAKQVMLAHGFHPDFPPQITEQLAELKAHPPQIEPGHDVRDLRNLLWSSIDNDTSKDLDQIEVAERLPNGDIKVLIAIADVDAFVFKHSAIDDHAAAETTSVYTGVRIFPMLPEELSTGATSLLENADKLSVVTEFTVDAKGSVSSSGVYRAIVRNKAQLAYNGVGGWLDGTSQAPPKVAASTELQAQLKLQNQAAQALRKQRYQNGALNLETTEVTPVIIDQQIVDVAKQEKNPATDLIEDFMIAANGVIARLLEKVSSLRRIVKTPKRWDRIVQLAAEHGAKLPSDPDSKALNDFLLQRKAADPDHFADVSLAVIKLIGPGEYVLRLIKAVLAGQPAPYSDDELAAIAKNCTEKEDAARKVEREMTKHLAAVAMSPRIGQIFDALVTGVTPKGTFVRVLQPHVEGLLAQGQQGLDVGDRLRVKLIRTDVQRGYIDFARA
jgi:exoribonuclease R